MPSPNITVSLVQLRDMLIQRGTARAIPHTWAHTIAALDRKHEYCYVEFPSDDADNNSFPQLWHITDWLDTVAHRKQLKLQSEIYRQESYVNARNIERLTYVMSKITGLAKADAEMIARQICQKKDKEQSFKSMRCKFEIFERLDEQHKPVIKVIDYSIL